MWIERKVDARAESCNFEHSRRPYRRRVLRNEPCVRVPRSVQPTRHSLAVSADVDFPDDTATMIPPPVREDAADDNPDGRDALEKARLPERQASPATVSLIAHAWFSAPRMWSGRTLKEKRF